MELLEKENGKYIFPSAKILSTVHLYKLCKTIKKTVLQIQRTSQTCYEVHKILKR